MGWAGVSLGGMSCLGRLAEGCAGCEVQTASATNCYCNQPVQGADGWMSTCGIPHGLFLMCAGGHPARHVRCGAAGGRHPLSAAGGVGTGGGQGAPLRCCCAGRLCRPAIGCLGCLEHCECRLHATRLTACSKACVLRPKSCRAVPYPSSSVLYTMVLACRCCTPLRTTARSPRQSPTGAG